MTALTIHPDALVLPVMSTSEYERLADSIERDGLLEPITLRLGEILDGTHRHRACIERDVEPQFSEWDESCGMTTLEWVIAKNLHRRQLSTAQRAALAVELESRLAVAARERKKEAGKRFGQRSAKGHGQKTETPRRPTHWIESREVAGAAFGVSGASVQRLKRIRAKDPDVFDRVRSGKLNSTAALKAAGLPPTNAASRRTKQTLAEALAPLRAYLRHWDEERLYGVTPKEARRLLKQVQQVDQTLLEVERALEERSITSRALS